MRAWDLEQRGWKQRDTAEALGVTEDKSGFYLLPGIVTTYAPAGHTPIIWAMQTRDHLSVMGGMTADGKGYTLARQESLHGLHTIAFLVHWLRVTGKNLLVIGAGPPIHRRTEVTAFVTGTHGQGGGVAAGLRWI